MPAACAARIAGKPGRQEAAQGSLVILGPGVRPIQIRDGLEERGGRRAKLVMLLVEPCQ
jgi:hypothetical protein